MNVNWDKWQSIERRHNQLEADVAFCKERHDDAVINHRNAEISLLHTVGSQGLFRRSEKAAFMQDAKENTEDCLARHADHPIANILRHYLQTKQDKAQAADTLAKAESAFHEHGRSYHKLRHWIREQQSRGLLA